ncbi:MAG: hypothetical protein KFF77_11245 [Bacteroidetes bacterium]|nr:hypothetical protein [Bacteroidota bacterium]
MRAVRVSDAQPYAWRAAWLLSDCMETNDRRLRGRRDAFIAAIPDKADGHQRELLKILLRMDLGERHESRLFDACMSHLGTTREIDLHRGRGPCFSATGRAPGIGGAGCDVTLRPLQARQGELLAAILPCTHAV